MKRVSTYVILAVVLAGCEERSGRVGEVRQAGETQVKMVPLKPQRMQAGHIDFIPHERIPNLTKDWQRDQEFLVPEGAGNVALGKPVSSSCRQPIIGEPNMITDGAMTSRPEGSSYCDVELVPGVQHVTIDLQGSYDIYAVRFWHCYPMNPVYLDVIVQISEDADFDGRVHTLFNNDHDNSAGLGAGDDKAYVENPWGKVVLAEGLRARYVRLYSNGGWGNGLNHYAEVEVWATPAD